MKKLTKHILIGVLALAIAFSGSPITYANEEASIRDEMAVLEEMLADLARQLGTTSNQTTITIAGVPANFSFNQNLRQGSRGTDVRYLQIILNADLDTRLANTGAGSPGNETSYFGPITLNAVHRFQSKYSSEILTPINLVRSTGFVGGQTRAKLNQIINQGTLPTPTPTPTPDSEIMEALKELAEAVKELSKRVDALYGEDGDEGELSVSLRSDIRNVDVRPAQTKDVAMFRMEAEDSDITIQRIDIYVSGGTMTEFRGDVDMMAIKVDGEVVAERAINRDTVGRDDLYIRFSGLEIEVPADGNEDIVIAVTAADKTTFSKTSYTLGPTGENSVRGVDGAGITVYARSVTGRVFNLDHDTTGILEIRNDDTPKEGVVQIDESNSTEVELLNFKLVVKNSNIEMETLRVEFEGDYELEEIFQDALLYRGNTLIDSQRVTIKPATDGKEAFVVFEIDENINAGSEVGMSVFVDVFGMDMQADAVKIGTKLKADILASENTNVAYAQDTNIDLKGDLEGNYQSLYPSMPEFSLKGEDIERSTDRDSADAYLTIDVKAVEGDIVLTGITFTDGHWNAVAELNGKEVYDGLWTGSTIDSTIKKGDTLKFEIFGVFTATNTDYGWVRLAVESITWEDEEGNESTWEAGDYNFIEVLRTGRVHLAQQAL